MNDRRALRVLKPGGRAQRPDPSVIFSGRSLSFVPVSESPIHGRRERRKRLTRHDLLVAGRRLFGEKGLYESRIEDLSRHAGIAKGTLYGYFPSKEALIEAVVASGFSELLGHVHRRAQGAQTHEAVLARVAAAHLEFFEDHPDLMRILHQVRGLLKFNRPEDLPLRSLLADYLAGLAHVLAIRRPVQQDGSELLAKATLLFGAVSGISSTHAALGRSPGGDQPMASVRGLVALVLEGTHGGNDGSRTKKHPALDPRRARSRRKMVGARNNRGKGGRSTAKPRS